MPALFTALLIAILIVTGAATVVGGGLVLAAARRRELGAPDAPKQLTAGDKPGAERGFAQLRAGDIVQRGEVDYLVEGALAFDEDGHKWVGARLSDGEKSHWLYVGMERMGSLSKRWLDIDDSLELSGFPPETIVIGGARYNLDKRGAATAKVSGDVGALPGPAELGAESVLRCRWWRYEGMGNVTLVIEQWSGEYRALRGTVLGDTDLEMMPGS